MLVTWKIQSVFSNAYKCNSSMIEWNDIRTRTALFTELALGRKLIPFERQMFMFPRVCEVCKIDDQKILRNCDRCLCVSYCSDIHQTQDIQHADKCSLLKLCKKLDTSVNDLTYLSYLDEILSLHCSFTSKLENMEELFKKCSFPTEKNNVQIQKILCSELVSCPLTLLYFLQHIERQYCIKDELIVHIVGASNLECGVAKVWNIIPHWLNKVHKLHIVFIGPNVVHQENTFSSCYTNGKENKIKMELEFHKTLYHNYIQSEGHTHPQIIVAFNCGLHEYEGSGNDTWKSTLPCFFKLPDLHIIITSYTKSEAVKDRDILMSFSDKADILFDCIDNPFSSNRPHRDWDNMRSDVFFINRYASVVHVN
ncbi:Uncharacterized protein GBIM_02646 [Gryllus bimaculatus]|nr:Uncharacterized protein GBIM_02646 [Gryllus bimaculatus]